MAHKKAGGSAKNLKDSGPQYLGTKLHDGEQAKSGSIIVRQRGTVIMAGSNVEVGRDHTLFAKKAGTVKFALARKTKFDGRTNKKALVSVIPA